MSAATTRIIRLAAYPNGLLAPSDLKIEETTVPALESGKIELALRWVALDPLIRIRIDAAPLGGNVPPVPLGEPMLGPCVAEVVKSEHPGFAVGDFVEGRMLWQENFLSDGTSLKKVDLANGEPSTALGVLGLPGFTAYVGLRLVPNVAAGGTLLVSGASGAVGSVVGQLGKARGLRVIGLASSPRKLKHLVEELGFDLALDRNASDLKQQLKEAAPTGCDIYFDNVGGDLFPVALAAMKQGGNVLVCGAMADYGAGGGTHDQLPGVLLTMMARSLTVKAFGSIMYKREMEADFYKEVGPMVKAGKIKLPEHVTNGFENIPEAFAEVFRASHIGKALVKIGASSGQAS